MTNPLSRSLPLRLLAIFIATSIVALIALSVTFSRGLGSQWRQAIEPHLARYTSYVLDDLGYPPTPLQARALAEQIPVDFYLYTDAQFIYSTNGERLPLESMTFKQRPESADTVNPPPHPSADPTMASSEDWRRTVLRAHRGAHTVYIEFARHRDHRRHSPQLRVALGLLLLILLACYALIRRQLRPIEAIQRGVRHMSGGQLDYRIRLPGTDDLAQLGHSVDAMADRLQAMLDAKRQLLLALSHELRTPLTRARVASELLPESTYRDRIRNDIEEMDRLIHDIIESERLKQHAVLHLEPVDLCALARAVINDLEPTVTLHMPDSRICMPLDASRIAILLRNLLGNALLHGTPGPTQSGSTATGVSLTLRQCDSAVSIEVADQGPGIPTEHRPAVTDAFYRADPARARDTGGYGLGLTLAKLIAQAHGGTLEIDSEPGIRPGTRVRVTLPAERHAHPQS